MIGKTAASLVLPLVASLAIGGCGAKKKDSATSSSGGTVATGAGGTTSQPAVAGLGDVFLKKVNLTPGTPYSGTFTIGAGASLAFDGAEAVLSLGSAAATGGAVEISVDNPDGTEAAYSRTDSQNPGVLFSALSAGDFTVSIKDNASSSWTLGSTGDTGAASAGGVSDVTGASADRPLGDVLIKAVVGFGKTCRANAPDHNSVVTTKAPATPGNQYYVQPFVFIGRVAADQTVTPITSAAVTITSGTSTITLKTIDTFPLAVIEQQPDLPLAQHTAWTRNFYEAYFGAAGEMYTTDIFRFGGDCANAVTFDLGTDPGTADIEMTVVDTTQTVPINATFKVQPSALGIFSMYQGDGTKLSNYTECEYDQTTGKPKAFNVQNASDTCKTFSIATPPYVMLDYKLPSAGGNGITAASDPTRIMYFGYSQPSAIISQLITQGAAVATSAGNSLTVPGCLSTGGLVSVPIATTKTYLPLAEFNAVAGDVVQLGYSSGSYTALTDFYQGNVNSAGSITAPTCIPLSGSCDWQMVTFNAGKCSVAADSGVSVLSINDSLIYPEFYTMSGIIAN